MRRTIGTFRHFSPPYGPFGPARRDARCCLARQRGKLRNMPQLNGQFADRIMKSIRTTSSSTRALPREKESITTAIAATGGLTLLLLLALAQRAPAAETTGSTRFEGAAQVIEVEVPVNVVDAGGQPVTGLTPNDFIVFDEGKEQALTDFEMIDLETIVTERTGVAPPQPRGARRPRRLLFDQSFSDTASGTQARGP
ncbi:MAG: hypothetical protein AAF772_20680, partial [Acidobacteriota bacterium]